MSQSLISPYRDAHASRNADGSLHWSRSRSLQKGELPLGKIRRNWECTGYGPVDLLEITKGSSTMRLLVQDGSGRNYEAVYRGCIYWRLDQQAKGIHLRSVTRVSARDLLRDPRSLSVAALHRQSPQVAQLLHDWENSGLSFYLHRGNASYMEFLVVCQSLEYRAV